MLLIHIDSFKLDMKFVLVATVQKCILLISSFLLKILGRKLSISNISSSLNINPQCLHLPVYTFLNFFAMPPYDLQNPLKTFLFLLFTNFLYQVVFSYVFFSNELFILQ